MTSINRMTQHSGDYYYPQFGDTVWSIINDIFIFIIKEQYSEQKESE
jgi:hypothetical protein